MKWKLGLYRGLQGLGFPKIRATVPSLGVPIRRIMVFGLYWGPLFHGKYHVGVSVGHASLLLLGFSCCPGRQGFPRIWEMQLPEDLTFENDEAGMMSSSPWKPRRSSCI